MTKGIDLKVSETDRALEINFYDETNIFCAFVGDLVDKATILNPYYDYVSPELVDLYITNT